MAHLVRFFKASKTTPTSLLHASPCNLSAIISSVFKSDGRNVSFSNAVSFPSLLASSTKILKNFLSPNFLQPPKNLIPETPWILFCCLLELVPLIFMTTLSPATRKPQTKTNQTQRGSILVFTNRNQCSPKCSELFCWWVLCRRTVQEGIHRD